MKRFTSLAVVLLMAACTKSPEPSRAPAPGPTQHVPASPQLPPGLSPGLLVKPNGFRGLTFYPGSEDKTPGATPGPGAPSVRLTSDEAEKVAAFYRQRLGNTVQESRAGQRIVIDGLTPAGGVRVTVESVERRTQVTIAQK